MNQRFVALLVFALLTGCGPGWQRTDPTPGAVLPERDQYLIHHGDSTDRWHAIRVSDSTISGVPWLQTADCDSCRVSLLRTSVDSMEIGHPVRGFWKGAGLVYISPFLIFAAFCFLHGEGPACWIPPST